MTIERAHLATSDFSDVVENTRLMPPVTPGEILREDFTEPLGLSANALAKALKIPPNRITAVLMAPAPSQPIQPSDSRGTSTPRPSLG